MPRPWKSSPESIPAYADALTEFAVELLLDDAIADEADVDETDDSESVSPAVSRAISFFQNAVYELEMKSAAPLRSRFAAEKLSCRDGSDAVSIVR